MQGVAYGVDNLSLMPAKNIGYNNIRNNICHCLKQLIAETLLFSIWVKTSLDPVVIAKWQHKPSPTQ